MATADVGASTELRHGRQATWHGHPPSLKLNNVHGRAEFRKNTTCCKYIGQMASLSACIRAAEGDVGGVRATSVTWHNTHDPRTGRDMTVGWAGSCFAVVDGSWMPVPVKGNEAMADSARRSGLQPLPPVAVEAFADGWVADATTSLEADRIS